MPTEPIRVSFEKVYRVRLSGDMATIGQYVILIDNCVQSCAMQDFQRILQDTAGVEFLLPPAAFKAVLQQAVNDGAVITGVDES